MLYLLDKDVRTVRWNGEPLNEATSAIVKETMNGDFTLTVKYPISDSGIYQLIQEDMLIKAPTPVLGAQLFRIKKPVEHNDHLEITAYHISDDVMQRSITPVSVTSQSCGMALSHMVQNTKTALGDFSFNSDIQDRRTFNTTETETLYSVLLDGKHSIVGTWEGELVRDNFAMTIKKSRGENRGVVITTHKNLKDYQRTKNSQNVVTRIHAKSTFKPEGAEKETTIRVTVDSPLINSYPYINEKEYKNNNAKTVEELQKWAQSKFSNEGIDKVSDAIKIEAYELDGQVVHMGDTVNLKSWKHNVDAFKKAIAYEFDALKEEYISLTFDDKAGVGGSRVSGGLSSAAAAILGVTESAQEIALEKALQNADLGFDHQAGLLRQEIADGIELARAKAEEVKRELSDTIDQRFSSFNNGPLQEAKRRAEEALRSAGASSLLAQEAKRIGLDSVAKLEEFKRQSTSAQTALSGDLDALKRTIANDIRPKQEQVTAEVAKQVKALGQTRDELLGIKSAQATYEETTTRRLSELTNLANGKASKSEVVQTAEELKSRIASVQASGRNLFLNSLFKQDIRKTGIWTTSTYTAAIDSESKYLGHNALKIVGQDPAGKDGGNPKITYPATGQYGKVAPGSMTNQEVTISFYAKAEKAGTILRSRFGNIGFKDGNVTLTTEVKRYVVKFSRAWTGLSNLTTNEWLFNLNRADTVWIWMPKFEVSDTDTPYSEAPEDIESQISAVESTFKQRADSLEAGVNRLTEGFRTKADISALNVTAENIRQSVKSLETDTQNKLNQKLSTAEFDVRASGIRQEIINATKDKADKTLVVSEAGKLRTELSTVQDYINKDGQRQEELRKYTREESARQATAVRELVTRDYVGKSTFQESVQGVERRLESYSLGISGNLLKNSNDGFRNQHAKRYRLVETLQVNQTYTLVTKYWHGEKSTSHTFSDGTGNWRHLTYNRAIDAWMIQFIPTKEIPAGTELTLSSHPSDGLGNMAWATLVRGHIPLTYWQPAKGDVEEGVTQKLAEYKETIDGRFANIVSQIANKANQTDFQRVQETSKLYERIIGSNENDISNKVARMALTNQLFQVEVAKAAKGGRNYIRNGQFKNGSKNWLEYQSVNFGLNFNYQHSQNPNNRNRPGLHFYHESQDVANFFGIQQSFAFDGVRGEKVSVSLLVSKDGGDSNSGLKVGLHYIKNKNIAGQEWQNIPSPQITSKYKRFTFTFTLSDDVENLNLMLYGEKGKTINLYVTDVQLERGSVATDYKEAPEDTEEAIRTVQTQLAGSWSVQNINSAGDIISGINLGADGRNRVIGKSFHITGETLIDNAVIKSAMVDKLKTANFEAGSVTTVVLDAEAVTSEKLKVDQALFNKLVANEAYLSQLFAKQAFINRVQSVAIDASQVRSGILSGDRIYGGTIRGANIFGGTLTGHTKIQLGSYGSFDTVNGGLQINVPRDYNAKDGLGVQFIGSYGRGENVPYGLFLYRDSDFTIGNTATDTDEFLMTVQGYINAKGIGWLKTGKGSVNGKTTGTIGLWNSDNVSLSFGGSGNDIYYSYNGTAYSLWTCVNAHFSDRRLKENIVDCKHKALDYIQKFQFKEYDWKKQEDRPQQAHTKIGLIAQEVQEVDPTLVYENGDTLNLDNLRLTNIALKAIQELALENKTLTHRLENLENERRTA